MFKTTYNQIAMLAFLCFAAASCQTMTEESPINPLADSENVIANSGDENARKGNFLEFGAFLTGAEEVPEVMSPGSGAANFKVVDNGNAISFQLRVANTTGIIFAHLHQEILGENGPVVVTLIPPQPAAGLQNGVIITGMITKENLSGPLSGADLEDLLTAMKEGKIYVNIHTETNRGGELRGQVNVVQANFNINSLVKLSGANEVPMVATDATGVAKFQENVKGSGISFQVNVDGISNVRFAHIHIGKPGANGPVVYTLRGDRVEGAVSGVYAKGTITAPMLTGPLLGGDLVILREAMRTGNAYVNLHSDKAPGGELRGNF